MFLLRVEQHKYDEGLCEQAKKKLVGIKKIFEHASSISKHQVNVVNTFCYRLNVIVDYNHVNYFIGYRKLQI